MNNQDIIKDAVFLLVTELKDDDERREIFEGYHSYLEEYNEYGSDELCLALCKYINRRFKKVT